MTERYYDYFTTENDDGVSVVTEDHTVLLATVIKHGHDEIVLTPKETYRLVRHLLAAAFEAERDT